MNTVDSASPTRALLGSVMAGIAAGLMLLGLLYAGQVANLFVADVNPVQHLLTWITENLRASVYAFAGVLVLFLVFVDKLRYLLQVEAPLAQISQVEYLADLCTSLFFGIGVIWTAIGMRSALLAGLGGLDSATAAEVGAFEILRKLVDGGILLALSTTIVGGVGGYLMRIYKSIRVGAVLRRRYMAEAHASEQAVLDRLDAIHNTMNALNIRMASESDTAESGQRSQ